MVKIPKPPKKSQKKSQKVLKTLYEDLNLIKAGAGAGKTFHIQKTLIEWIKDGKISADRILAVTFTNAAANELKERIRMALLQADLYEESKLLQYSQISTIHQFGSQLLKSFSFELGASPQPRQLTETEEKLLIQKMLTQISHILPIINNLDNYGYKLSYGGDDFIDATDVLKKHVNKIISSLRSIGAKSNLDKADIYLQKAEKDIRLFYGKNQGKASTLNNTLWKAINTIQKQYTRDDLLAEWGSNADTRNFVNVLYKVTQDQLKTDWAIWVQLQSIETAPKIFDKKTGDTTHQDSHLAFNVWNAADNLSIHPGPLNDSLKHIKILLNTVFEALSQYRELKTQGGLIDFNDMVQLANQILSNKSWLKEVKEQYDCVIIDEFQDTNPLQFAMLWSLHQAGIPTLIVGDIKQSIMQFQGSDSRLFSTLLNNRPENTNELLFNWRSSDPLMKFINQLGKNLYDDQYTELTPKAKIKSNLDPVVFLNFDDDNWSINGTKTKDSFSKESPYVVCNEIKTLLSSGVKVTDKISNQLRPIQANDIAILSYSHKVLSDYTQVLREFGIEPLLNESGWFESESIQKMFYALSYIANHSDKHALLYLTLLMEIDFDFQPWFKTYMEQKPPKKLNLSLESDLIKITQETRYQSLEHLMRTVVETLGLWDEYAKTGAGQQQRANLLKLIQLTKVFEESKSEALEAQGIYGKGLPSFLVWLNENKDDIDTQPKVSSKNKEAVVLSTWHASKGLEWPVVIVVGMEKELKSYLPNTSVQYGKTKAITGMLSNAYCQLFTDVYDPKIKQKFIDYLDKESHETLKNLTYVVMTRAREQLILPWFNNGKPNSMNSILAKMDLKKIKRKNALMPALPLKKSKANKTVESYGRILIKSKKVKELIPGQIVPSSSEKNTEISKASLKKIKYYPYGQSITLDEIKTQYGATQPGTWLHQFYQAILTDESFTDRVIAINPEVAENKVLVDELVAQITDFKQTFLSDSFLNEKTISWKSEVPVLSVAENGATINGVIDLLVETEEGYWIIDHKTDQISDDPKKIQEQFEHHLGQLLSYKENFKFLKPVLGVGINWVALGQVSLFST